MDTTKMPSRRP